jgi:hypothetical protein
MRLACKQIRNNNFSSTNLFPSSLSGLPDLTPHVGFYDVHGRVLERLAVQDLLSSVYHVDPAIV